MRKILRADCTPWLAWGLVLSLLSGPGWLGVAPVSAQALLPTVAVVQVANQSGSSVQNIGSRAAAALNERLASSGVYTVLGQDAVNAALTANGVSLPLRAATRDETLARLAAALGADYLLLATIDSVQSDVGQKLAVVKSRLQVYGRAAKGDVVDVEVTAFNVDRSTDEMLLIDDALEQNAMTAVREITRHLNIRGKVLTPPLEETVRVTLDQSADLRLGDRLVVLRNGVRIAVVELQAVTTGDAECRIVERTRPDLEIGVNDEVQLYRQGTGRPVAADPDLDSMKQRPSEPERRHKSNATLWAIVGGALAIAAGVWLVTRNAKQIHRDRTPSLVAPPDNAVLLVDTENKLIRTVSFTTTTTFSTDAATFQIATDNNFRQIMLSSTQTGSTTTTRQTTEDQATTEPEYTFIYTPSLSDPFLPPGSYFWRVIAVSGPDQHYSNVFRFTVQRPGGGTSDALRSPDTVTALSGDSSVEIQWTPVEGATGYRIYRRVLTPRFANELGGSRMFRPSSGSNAWLRGIGRRSPRDVRGNRRPGDAGSRQTVNLAGFSELAQVTANTLSYTDSTVSNGTEYQWVVLTESGATVTPLAEAQASSFVSTTPLGTAPPATPTNFTATPGDGQVTLTWSPNTENDLAGYQVFRSTAANGNFVDITNNLVTDDGSPAEQGLSAGPGDVAVTDRGLTNGVQVFYRIRAVQLRTVVNGVARGGLESPLSDAVQATPSSAPPQELQVIQPPNNSTVDADRPLLAWRGVEGASQYTVQIATDPNFTSGLVETTSTDTEIIYPSGLPALTTGTQYYLRVGVFSDAQQALRFGPTSTFTRGQVVRHTVTVRTTRGGAAFNGARVSIDGADTGELTPAQFILAPKSGDAPYVISVVFNDTNGTRLAGSANYRPGRDSANVVIALQAQGIAPAAPTGLLATGEADRIVLRWNVDPNLGVPGAIVATRYSIRRRSNTLEGPFTEVATVTAPTSASNNQADRLMYTDFNVRSGVRYFYRIVALSAAGVESLESFTANAVAGVGTIQVLTPQDNQTFAARITGDGQSWTSQIDFAWVAAAGAARYIFEIGTDPDLNRLLENGNEVIAAGDSPATSVTLGATVAAPAAFVDDGDLNTVTLYWRVVAVDENNLVINQSEARRFFVNQPGVIVRP